MKVKERGRKLLSILLTCVLLLGLMPTVAFAAPSGVEINETNFPDAYFRSYVAENFDTDKSGTLSDSECQAVTEIVIQPGSVADLTGIEYFTELTILSCVGDYENESAPKLTSLDLSANTKLESVVCSYNSITELDVSMCTALEYLECHTNNLTALKVNPQLKKMHCYGNPQLQELDLRNATVLKQVVNEGEKAPFGTDNWEYSLDGNYLIVDAAVTIITEDVYDVWLGEKQVTSANKDNLADGTASYDPTTKTLTLNSYDGDYIKAEHELTIKLTDGTTNKITVPEETEKYGIHTLGVCKLTGVGDLDIVVEHGNYDGIYAERTTTSETDSDLIINMSGNLNVNAGDDGLFAYDDVIISGSGDIAITAGTDGIYTNNGQIDIRGSGDLTVNATGCSLCPNDGHLILSGSGSVTATSTGGTLLKATMRTRLLS